MYKRQVSDIVRESHVSISTLYAYFESKEALLNHVYREAGNELGWWLMRSLVNEGGKPPRFLFKALWLSLLRFVADGSDRFELLARTQPRALDAENKSGCAAPAGLVEALDHLFEKGGLRAADRELVASVIWATLGTFFRYHEARGTKLDGAILDELEDICWQGIKDPAAPANTDFGGPADSAPPSE